MEEEGCAMLNLTSVIDFSLSEIKNKIKKKKIISDDSKTRGCDDIWNQTKHGVISIANDPFWI